MPYENIISFMYLLSVKEIAYCGISGISKTTVTLTWRFIFYYDCNNRSNLQPSVSFRDNIARLQQRSV